MDGVVASGEVFLWSEGLIFPCVWANLDLCVRGEMAHTQSAPAAVAHRLLIHWGRQCKASPTWWFAALEVILVGARGGLVWA